MDVLYNVLMLVEEAKNRTSSPEVESLSVAALVWFVSQIRDTLKRELFH